MKVMKMTAQVWEIKIAGRTPYHLYHAPFIMYHLEGNGINALHEACKTEEKE